VKHILAGPSFDLFASYFTKKYLRSYSYAHIFLPRLKQKYLQLNRHNTLHTTLELIGDMIKVARKERQLTQEQLGELIGAQKSQISKLKNNTKNVTIGTILKVFEALKTKVNFKVELLQN